MIKLIGNDPIEITAPIIPNLKTNNPDRAAITEDQKFITFIFLYFFLATSRLLNQFLYKESPPIKIAIKTINNRMICLLFFFKSFF